MPRGGAENIIVLLSMPICDFYLMLIIDSLANSLDPDQDQHSVGPDLDPNCVFLKDFWKKWFWKKSADDNKSTKKITEHAKSLKILEFILFF